MKARIYKQLAK